MIAGGADWREAAGHPAEAVLRAAVPRHGRGDVQGGQGRHQDQVPALQRIQGVQQGLRQGQQGGGQKVIWAFDKWPIQLLLHSESLMHDKNLLCSTHSDLVLEI